jgi:diketogulonate reductase-like aldo/keto reductase
MIISNSVTSALQCGYSHIDTALAYGNEESVGKVMEEIY